MKKALLAFLFVICQSIPAIASPPPIPPGPPGIAANGGTGNNITLNGTTNITGSASNAVTQPPVDNTVRIATDQFVQSLFAVTRSTVYLSGVTGGTLSFASVGTGAAFSFTATGGVITSIDSVYAGGSGYKVGDVLYIPRGNYDNYIRVSGVSGTAITSVQILNGGTGNTSGLDITAMAAIEAPIIYNVSGTLTSNLQVIASNGAVLGYSGIFLLYNNTTGNYSEQVCISNGSDSCNGNGSVVIPQGSSNSCPTLVNTDGATPWLTAKPLCATGSATYLSSGSGTIPAGATQFRIIGIGGGGSGAGGGTVASTGSGGGGGGSAAKIDTGWLPVSSLPQLSYSVVIGNGGASAAAGAVGNTGSNSSVAFGSVIYTFDGANNSSPTAGSSGAGTTGGGGGLQGVFSSGPNGVGNSGLTTYYTSAASDSGDGCNSTGTPQGQVHVRYGPSAGAAGGGLNSGTFIAGGTSPTLENPSNVGNRAGAIGGLTAGASGSSGTSNTSWPSGAEGVGGGGGAGNGAGVGGAGGAGGYPGGGGGGGGSGTTGGGTGGAGGNGAVFMEWQ